MKCPFCAHISSKCGKFEWMRLQSGYWEMIYCVREFDHTGFCVHCNRNNHSLLVFDCKKPKEAIKLKIR